MSEQIKDTLILGGGPAGMACAMELYNAGMTSSIIEKEDKIGGLAKTFEFREEEYVFRTDIGFIDFFSKNQYLYDFIENLLKEKWIIVPRQTRQFIDGKFYGHPINAMQAFRNIGLLRAVGMVFSYFNAIVRYRFFNKKIVNFEPNLCNRF